jgi:predicted dehydrogenase
MSIEHGSDHRTPEPRPTRRELLLGVAGGAALFGGVGCAAAAAGGDAPATPAAATGPAESSSAAASSKPLGVALLGLGDYSTTQLAPALAATRLCRLRGIVTGSPDKAAKWQREHDIPARNVYDYESLPRIADNPDIDVIYVVTPTALHAKYAIMAAQAGKHVWCEKPMAMTVAECESIIDACKQNGVSLSLGYRMQHEPNTQTVMRFAREQPYGRIQRIEAVAGSRTDGDEGWRMLASMGGGALYDMGVYSINAIRYASGEEPVRVLRARQWADRPELFREVDESTEFELELPSGAIGYGRASRFDPKNYLRVEAQRGWYRLEPMQAYRGVKGETSDGKKLDQRVERQQTLQMDDDARAILERRPPMVPGEEGLRDIRILQGILRCVRSGAPVTL